MYEDPTKNTSSKSYCQFWNNLVTLLIYFWILYLAISPEKEAVPTSTHMPITFDTIIKSIKIDYIVLQ